MVVIILCRLMITGINDNTSKLRANLNILKIKYYQ